ncbi:MAG: hypothetical protein ABL908_08995 [Hyphomicrobium sp.]
MGTLKRLAIIVATFLTIIVSTTASAEQFSHASNRWMSLNAWAIEPGSQQFDVLLDVSKRIRAKGYAPPSEIYFGALSIELASLYPSQPVYDIDGQRVSPITTPEWAARAAALARSRHVWDR